MEAEVAIEDVGGDGLTVSFNTTLVRGLMIACVFVVVSFFFLIFERHDENFMIIHFGV